MSSSSDDPALDDLRVAQSAIIANPANPANWVRLGSAHYQMTGAGPAHYVEAHLAYERALNMAPSMPGAAMGVASTSYTFGQIESALEWTRVAQHDRPFPAACLAEAGILLKLGRWREGWEKFEARLDHAGQRTKRFVGSLSDLRGKTVFVRGEQGFGDNIQFSRYLHAMKPFCGHLMVEATESMATLMTYLSPVGSEIITETDRLLGDVQISIMSLPLLLGEEIGWEPVPPVKPDFGREYWAPTRVGICPASLVGSPTSKRKNPPPELFAGLIDDPVSLMFEDMIPENGGWDWLDTAAFLEQSCRFVISVDTAVAHLAATMGMDVWLLQRFDSCWRWDHPNWYPKVRMFQQTAPGDWRPVFDKVREALASN